MTSFQLNLRGLKAFGSLAHFSTRHRAMHSWMMAEVECMLHALIQEKESGMQMQLPSQEKALSILSLCPKTSEHDAAG